MQHEGLGYFYGSGDIRPFRMRVPLLEAPLTRCFIGGPYTAAQPSNGKELDPSPRYTPQIAVGRVRPSTPVVPCARL